MKDIFTVAKFTMHDMLSRKSFRISTIIIIILIILGFNVPNILQTIGNDNLTNQTLIADPENLYEGNLEKLNDLCPSCGKASVTTENPDIIKQQIIDGEVDSAIIISKTDQNLHFNYLVKNTVTNGQLPENLFRTLEKIYLDLQISHLDLSTKELASLSPNITVEISQTDETEIAGSIFAMMMLSIVLFYAIYFCAFQVSSSITTEKTSRIMETLVTSTSPSNIILGKTIGIGIIGLLQMMLFVATALISAQLFLDSETVSHFVDVSHLTITLGVVTALYFILGYFAYAFGYALTGSTVSKPEDVQSANTPVALLAAISFYLAYFTLTDPTSNLNIFAAIFPFSSPFCMPIRMIMGLASPSEICVSLTILAITILLIAHIAIRIYSNAILHYGTKMSWKEIWQSYKAKS